MKVFSLKKYMEDMGHKSPLDWAKECDGQPVKGNSCSGKNGVIFWVCEKWCEETSENKLIFKGNKTILIKDGKEYVSKCADGDVYDKEKGLLLCLAKANGVSYDDLQKMIDGAEDKNKEAAEKAVDALFESVKAFVEAGCKALKERDKANAKPEAEKSVKEVKRPAKVGEYIKIVNAGVITCGTYKNGDILKVYKICKDGVFCETEKKLNEGERETWANDKGNMKICKQEYVVLKNYKPYKITLSEFWKSEDKLAIRCKDEKDKSKLLEVMREKGFFVKGNNKSKGTFDCVTNEKNLLCVDINTVGIEVCEIRGGIVYEFNEVDLNN